MQRVEAAKSPKLNKCTARGEASRTRNRETFRPIRIVGKCLSWELKAAIQVAAGPLQVWTGLKIGSEAAVHYMRKQFEIEFAEVVILVDASNAFNSVNRQALLHNVKVLCPSS